MEQSSQYIPFMKTLAIFMKDGGIFMWIIFWVWVLGIGTALERLKNFSRFDINGKKFMSFIKNYVVNNNVEEALVFCSNSKALLPSVSQERFEKGESEQGADHGCDGSSHDRDCSQGRETTLLHSTGCQYLHTAGTAGDNLRAYSIVCSGGAGRPRHEGTTVGDGHIQSYEYYGTGNYSFDHSYGNSCFFIQQIQKKYWVK